MSRAGRTGRSWYGCSYIIVYADPTGANGERRMGGETNKRRAIACANRKVILEGCAWARVEDEAGNVIARVS